ncbi:MAG: hypothetical protein KAW12_26425 [Candidatus Aminicenantes bacterium]|nr:hypothetical protein [Candidatus Aminicenantes bacterium]
MKRFYFLLSILIVILPLPVFSGCSSANLKAEAEGVGVGSLPSGEKSHYESLWQEVENYNSKGLPKSALQVVEKIYSAAKKENRPGEFAKALIHKLYFIQQVEEDAVFKVHSLLTGELKQSRFPITPVLHSMLAEQYWSYYRANRYRFLNRTAVAPGAIKQDDIRTWDLKKIVEEVVRHYQKSLQNADKAKETKIDIYDRILHKRSSGRRYRPTLYDFLAHRAVDFFMGSESSLTQPVYRFTLNNKDYFKPARDFAGLKISTRDPLSFRYYALTYLQELIRFHLADKDPAALVDVDLKRLRFIYKEGVISNKEISCEKTLKQMMTNYPEAPVSAEIYYELAALYNELGDKYKPGNKTTEKYKWYKKRAHNICREAIKKYPASTGAGNCAYLIDRIEGRKLDMTLQGAVASGKPFQVLVKYKNLGKVYFKMVKTSMPEIAAQKRKRYADMVAFYISKQAVETWQTAFPGDGDFQAHAAEAKVRGLETGEYVLLAADSSAFDFKKHAVAYTFFTVSNIAYVHRRSDKKGLEFHLLHRHTGAPLGGASGQVWYREYHRPTRSYVLKKGPLFRADVRGYFHISRQAGLKNYFRLEFSSGSDRLFEEREFYLYRSYDRYPQKTSTFFFTDRAIYRPGQSLHFKGIILHRDSAAGENNRILPNRRTRVTLYDVNRQKVSHLDLISNEYGTFSGTFQLPLGRLNGRMRISDSHGSSEFSVEEYKRPKFQVTFDALKKTYKLDDMVTVTGKAAAYAGYNIDNADVKYRVVREVFFPYRWYYWGYLPPAPKMEILNEVGKTGKKGGFEITFKAVPDLTIDKKTQPAFNFVIYAEVTDINGETRQAVKRIPIGYTALKIGLNLPGQLDKDKETHTLQVNSSTLSGDFIPASGAIAFYRLKENPRVTRKKPWDAPDRFTMGKKDYYKDFPDDAFAREDDFRNWEKEKKVFQKNFDTGKSKELKLTGLGSWQSGKYVVEMESKDRYGSPVKEVLYFTLYSSRGKRVPHNRLDWFTIPEETVEPGKKAVVLFGSAAKNVFVIYEIEHRGKIFAKKYLTLSRRQHKIEIPIEEKHRGNVGVHITFVKYNEVFKHSKNIVVPWSNKNLDISFETFRDKLKPGEKEEWRIKIKPAKTGPAAKGVFNDSLRLGAEMVAALYDASLDAFMPHNWYFSIFPRHYNHLQWEGNRYFGTVNSRRIGVLQKSSAYFNKYYDTLNWFGVQRAVYFSDGVIGGVMKSRVQKAARPGSRDESRREAAYLGGKPPAPKKANGGKKKNGKEWHTDGADLSETAVDAIGAAPALLNAAPDLSAVKARGNFQETAFFYPHLRTGSEGEIIIAFTVPEALTTWKMLGFAHTKNLEYGLITNKLVTQKELMVVPNAPRFLREGDTLKLTAKITNLSEKTLAGKARLMLFDALTLQPVDAKFKNSSPEVSFSAAKGESALVGWNLLVPEDVDTVTYRIVAAAGKFSDGEEKPLPILKNRMLVTETLPLPLRSLQSKDFRFKKLIDSGKSTTLKHHKLTLEFTSNPVWYAVQALPYLMEYPYECMEQVFSRYYANSIASFIVNSNPKIKRVFDVWKSAKGGDALLSNLEKNQELKTLLLEETPWVLNAQDESQRKKRIALLFDLNKMAGQLQRALQKLKDGQLASGAWPWFHGMRESRYITQHIVCGFAHLGQLGVFQDGKAAHKAAKAKQKFFGGAGGDFSKKTPARRRLIKEKKLWDMLKKAVPYLDRKIKEDYRWLLKHDINLNKRNIGYMQVHYLYARSYFKDIPMDDSVKKAFTYYKGQAKKYWLDFNIYVQGMISLSLHRYGDPQTPAAIVKSLKEHALHSEEMGMYWKSSYGYYWYQAPIETHALLIEVFSEVARDSEAVDELKTWLLKQKQTQDWRTTKATVDACYALLLKGEDWLAESKQPGITIGKTKKIKIEPEKMDNVNIEAGSGYFKTSWSGAEVTSDMGYISIRNNNKIAAWGGMYWQYFENLDKITPAKTPLQLKKQLFIERPSDTGPVLTPLHKRKLRVGDRVKVRIELRIDRTLEYVHMKDMRASGFEPENVISRCKWQGGLCYYESTKDASTNFFFDYLPKGTYVFEYPLRVSHAGDFSNGITTIQCMYAPEFSSHSEGVRVKIAGK